MTIPTDVFVSYAGPDELAWLQLEKHLRMLDRKGVIRTWGHHKLSPGEDWVGVVSKRLDSSRLILLLLSPDFFASERCYDVEVDRALALKSEGKAEVIAIRVRPYDWDAVPFSHLRTLPANGHPVTTWTHPDDAWVEVAREVRLALALPHTQQPNSSMDAPEGKFLLTSWDASMAEARVLDRLRGAGTRPDSTDNVERTKTIGDIHELHSLLYVKYIERAAYVAVGVTRVDPNDACHVSGASLSFVEFVETPAGWREGTVHMNALYGGSWGYPPYKILALEIGYNIFGIAIEDGFTNHGCTDSYTSIYTTISGKFVEVFSIHTYASDSATGRPPMNEWTARVEVVRAGSSFYDLIVHRNGARDGRRLDEKQLYRFDGKAYAPADLYR